MTDIFAESVPEDDGGEALTFSTTLKPSSFLGLSLKNGLLNLITLTLYRFWGKTEVRQRVWKGIRLNDDAFEYTGRGVELFIGFLLALVVLGVPFLALVFAVQFIGEWVIYVAYLPLYIFAGWLWGFGTYTAFRYMASRTTWRGIRFQLKGSAAKYGWSFLGAMFLSGITWGWYWPAAERNLAEKIWDELRFGDRRLRFRMGRAQQEGVYGPYAIGWVGTGVGYVLVMLAVVAVGMTTGQMGEESGATPGMADAIMLNLAIYGVLILLSPFFLLIWAPYQAAMMRSITRGVTVDGATFTLKVGALSLWWLTVTNLFFLLITFGFLMPWVQARTGRFLVSRLKSEGTARLALAQQADRGPGSGEGLADAFGFSAI
ncbi:YjgN family protein [Brevundimonas sp. FT23028]|uniref:YjgN family protein n=1 Tax=Brevundimonas sp. FT23028 TaxID=3393748 RepID=UPI003B58A88D